MQHFIIFLLLLLLSFQMSFAQNQTYFGDQLVRKGRFYAYLGWNRVAYTPSDMHFSGEDYEFTLSKVQAWDDQTKFDGRLYLKPRHFAKQQTNFRFGYFFKEKWTVSLGVDHMKYVIPSDHFVRIDGIFLRDTAHWKVIMKMILFKSGTI